MDPEPEPERAPALLLKVMDLPQPVIWWEADGEQAAVDRRRTRAETGSVRDVDRALGDGDGDGGVRSRERELTRAGLDDGRRGGAIDRIGDIVRQQLLAPVERVRKNRSLSPSPLKSPTISRSASRDWAKAMYERLMGH